MYAALMEVIEHADEGRDKLRASRSSFHTISVSPSCNALRQRSRAGRLVLAPVSLVLKDFLASGFLQCRELQGGVLVLGRDSRVAVFHGSNLQLQT
jgi:hypothetical protein